MSLNFGKQKREKRKVSFKEVVELLEPEQKEEKPEVKEYSNGERYLGTFKNGKKHGRGIYFYGNDDRYEGEFKDDQKDGFGTLFAADGSVLEGEWKADREHGEFEWTTSKGDRYQQRWDMGVLLSVKQLHKEKVQDNIPANTKSVILEKTKLLFLELHEILGDQEPKEDIPDTDQEDSSDSDAEDLPEDPVKLKEAFRRLKKKNSSLRSKYKKQLAEQVKSFLCFFLPLTDFPLQRRKFQKQQAKLLDEIAAQHKQLQQEAKRYETLKEQLETVKEFMSTISQM